MSQLDPLTIRVGVLAARLTDRRLRLATAESCTGGSLAAALTDWPGSSEWFEFGFIPYSNGAKQALLGVRAATLKAQGAVSRGVAEEMAEGALRVSGADLAVAVTGIAGPAGGTASKPVGTVWFAWAGPEGWPGAERRVFPGDRSAVRRQAVAVAIEGTILRLSHPPAA